MNRYLDSLRNIGLSEKEARVYLALLELNESSAYAIAEKAKIKRPTTYVILDELMKKGLVNKIPKVKKRSFIAKSPDVFFREQEQKVIQSKAILPELMQIGGNKQRKIKTVYYEGIKGIEDAISYGYEGTKSKEVVGFFASGEKVSGELMHVFEKWETKLEKHGVLIRGFTPDHPSTKEMLERDRALGHNLRTIPYEDYSSTVSIDAGDTFVRIIMNADQQAIVIENPDVAKTVRQIFEMLWKRT